MSWFANFLEGLRPLVYLFSKKHLRERYIATCCTGRLSSWSGAFKVNCSVHATWRWGTLQACLRYVIERKLAIQATFNRHMFSNPGNARMKKGCHFAEEDKAALKLDIISRKVHSRMWWAYAAVMNEAHIFIMLSASGPSRVNAMVGWSLCLRACGARIVVVVVMFTAKMLKSSGKADSILATKTT